MEMNPVAILNTQFVQVALPLMVTLSIAAWWNNQRVDDLRADLKDLKSDLNRRFEEISRRFEEMNRRFDRLEVLLTDHSERIAKLEERTSPLTRR